MSTRYLYNTSGKYVAFVSNRNVFTPDCEWLGYILNGNEIYDPKGKFFGYILNDDRVATNVTERKPNAIAPYKPFKPFRPFTPFTRLRMTPLPHPYRDVFESGPHSEQLAWPTHQVRNDNSFDHLLNSVLIAGDGQLLGKVNKNRFDPESLSNEFGPYGSQFQPRSIFNQFGNYGNPFSHYSPFNSFTHTAPKFVLNGQNLGTLTANEMVSGRIDPKDFLNWLKN